MVENRGLEGVWAALGRFLASRMLPRASGHLCGCISCALWRHLGALGGILDGSWAHLGRLLGASWGMLGRLGRRLGAPGGV